MKEEGFDIFSLRDKVISDYRNYIESFLKIRDRRVQEFVTQELDKGYLWQDPLIQLNPSYKRSATIKQLIQDGTLHPDNRKYFPDYYFYQHQEQAFKLARENSPYVVTTGTGSGKSLTYVVPIIDDLLRNPHLEGVRAILVYPMNALINSQEEEFNKCLQRVSNSHIRIAKYTGQESLAQKTEIQNNPPHILLTNYVMLELMLTRVHEEKLVKSPNFKFLVLDELHTYRGRQGADVAVVIRKLRRRRHLAIENKNTELLCIATSATMSSEGSIENRRQTVAEVACKVFGVEIPPENVIDETLERAIARPYPTIGELRASVQKPLPSERTLEAFREHPLSAWMEMNLGVQEQEGKIVRRVPISLTQGAENLAQQTQIDVDTCKNALQQMLLWSSKSDEKGLPFRLHQFISQGGSVYATLESHETRELTLEGQYKTTGDRLLFPLVFCRECGQDYYMVRYDTDKNTVTPLLPTAIEEEPNDESIQEGYLCLDEQVEWSKEDEERLPDNWFKVTKKHGRQPKPEYAAFIPKEKLYISPNGNIETSLTLNNSNAVACWFIPKPFLSCLHCGIIYDKKTSEYRKLSRLSSEGRSTATTLLCLSTVGSLKDSTEIDPKAAKILSFTDNRQDASLQAGHFNDFLQTSFLRASLKQALDKNPQLTYKQLATSVVQEMGLSQQDYAQQPANYGIGKKNNERAFQHLIEYRLYEDLRRGWRIVQPNLEQCGLLVIEYYDLEEMCNDEELWRQHPHPILLQATPSERFKATKILLDQLRRQLAIDAELLQEDKLEQLRQEVTQCLNDTWQFRPNELLYGAKWATYSQKETQNTHQKVKLTPRSQIGRFLRSSKAWTRINGLLPEPEYQILIQSLIAVLVDSGYLKKQDSDVQLRIDSMEWKGTNSNTILFDPLTSKWLQESENKEQEVNKFFQTFYQGNVQSLKSMKGREHTGQVTSQNRQEREESFRQGQLSALFCSPTMELGIDISDLSVVHLRNVPPSPANYAQRSGRAGRGGQEALVLTYASAGSSHDQYFYRRTPKMVAGIVVAPKLELANQDLIRSHLHSLWLSYTGVDFKDSMNQVLDLNVDGYPIKDGIKAALDIPEATLQQCIEDAKEIFADRFCLKDLTRHPWYTSQWMESVVKNALKSFDKACDRWRQLYKDAHKQLLDADKIVQSGWAGSVSQKEKSNANALVRDAQKQLDLLVGQTGKSGSPSEFEFYPYRYFAAEGFLPGFNFPRLPVRAYLKAGDTGGFLSRPRAVAIRELAPSNIVYYEGNKFQVAKTKVSPKGIEYQTVAPCPSCGYFHDGIDYAQDLCTNCQQKLGEKLPFVLTMDTMDAYRRERITCDEEERLKYGYHVTTHFRYDSSKQKKQEFSSTVKATDGTPLLHMSYGETAKLVRINRGLRRSKESGFKLNRLTGEWGDSYKNPSSTEDIQTGVNLMVSVTCNLLVIVVDPSQLPKTNVDEFLTTLQYALERGIQAHYKLENDELASERLGDGQRLLFWEASEGGAGVLSQLLNHSQSFQRLAEEALEICHFTQDKTSCVQACYECLLSYQNQFDHPRIDRHLIKDFLYQLAGSTVNDSQESQIARQEQYEKLLKNIDPNSPLEQKVLNAIYEQGLPLPDEAQEYIEEANCKPDFLYKKPKIAIFCDGSVHDNPQQQECDRVQRDNLRWDAGYEVVIFHYQSDLSASLNLLKGLI